MSPTEAKESTKREIAVEVPAAEVSRETEALIQKYQKLARLPGFRKGRVPASIIRQRFAEDIKTDVVESLVPRYFRQEADKQGLVPVSQPRVSDLHIHDGEPLRSGTADFFDPGPYGQNTGELLHIGFVDLAPVIARVSGLNPTVLWVSS